MHSNRIFLTHSRSDETYETFLARANDKKRIASKKSPFKWK